MLTMLGCAHRHLKPTWSHTDGALGEADDCPSFQDEALNRRLDRRTDSEVRQGNRADLLVNGEAAFARRFELTQGAELVLVKTFIFSDDEVGRQVADLLMERARAGALVIVQYDIKGSLAGARDLLKMLDTSDEERWLRNKPILDEMERGGVIVIPTNVPRRPRELRRFVEAEERAATSGSSASLRARFSVRRNFDHFDHEKYWITGHRQPDGTLRLEAILGGLNVASEYAFGGTDRRDAESGRGGWRDTDISLRGPVVNDIVDRFFDVAELNQPLALPDLHRQDWNPPQEPAGEARVRFVWNQPAIGNRRTIERLYRTMIRATPPDAVIRLEAAYFVPGRRVRWALHRALREDRRLAVLTNSRESTDLGAVTIASRAVYEELLHETPTAALYEWKPREGLSTLHSKVASFGRCGPVIVGSANLDALSSEHNSEAVVLVDDPTTRAAFDAMFDDDIGPACADRVTAQDIERTSWIVRAWRRGVYRIGWYWLAG